MGAGGQLHALAASTTGKDPVPIVQEAGWAPGPVWIDAENLAQPGFDPRTVQPVASRCTDYATRPTDPSIRLIKITVSPILEHVWLQNTVFPDKAAI